MVPTHPYLSCKEGLKILLYVHPPATTGDDWCDEITDDIIQIQRNVLFVIFFN